MAGLDSAWGSAAGRAHSPRTYSSVDLHVGDGAGNLLWLQMADLAANVARTARSVWSAPHSSAFDWFEVAVGLGQRMRRNAAHCNRFASLVPHCIIVLLFLARHGCRSCLA